MLQNNNSKNTKIKDKIYLSLILSPIFLILFANTGTEHIIIKIYSQQDEENETNDGKFANIVLTGSNNLTNPTLNMSSNVHT